MSTTESSPRNPDEGDEEVSQPEIASPEAASDEEIAATPAYHEERITVRPRDFSARKQRNEVGTSVIVHISDPHFGTERPDVAEALVEFCNEQAPSLVILSGDITQRARRHQFKAARKFADRMAPVPILAIPGNHDIPLFNLFARAGHPYANYRRAFGDELEPQWDNEHLQVTCVNTTRPRRHIEGEISKAQRERVSERLRAARPDQLRIVVTHQPMHVTRPEDEKHLLHGGKAAAHAWSDAGVDLLLGGHIHLPYLRPLRERYADISRDVWVVQAGTAISDRVRAGVPNSVNLIRHDAVRAPFECIVARCDHHAGKQRFVPSEIRTILLDRSK